MKTVLLSSPLRKIAILILAALCVLLPGNSGYAQVLINLNFGASQATLKTGHAGTGNLTNDYWNVYSHYQPRFVPGMAMVAQGIAEKLKQADGTETGVSVAVTNAPGVWGNSSGDPMFDTYMFAQNGSNITVTLRGLAIGRYHFFLYGHADADVAAEQNSSFSLTSGTNHFGPSMPSGGAWKVSQGWQERAQFVVFRDVPVENGTVVIDVAPGPGGIAVLNGLQILSRGTGSPRIVGPLAAASQGNTNLFVRELRYDGKVTQSSASFDVRVVVESLTTNEISAPFFDGDVALVAPELPKGIHIGLKGKQTWLFCSVPGVHELSMQLVPKVTREEPWNTVRFTGPAAAIASFATVGESSGMDLEMLTGTPVISGGRTNRSQLQGVLGSDRVLAIRWQSKGAEISRKSILTVSTEGSVQVSPTFLKYKTSFRYDILQAPVPRLTFSLPRAHALTRIEGDQIRDWQVKDSPAGQELTVEFMRPVEKACTLTLYSEQPIESTPVKVPVELPLPQGVERESGSVVLSADDTLLDLQPSSNLRQINAPAGSVAAYRFTTRPFSVVSDIRRVEPIVKAVDRTTVRVEETRLVVSHSVALAVEKAGIYSIEATPQPGFTVTEVTGEGVEEWKESQGRLAIGFTAKVLGNRTVQVNLEKATRELPEKIEILPLTMKGITNVQMHVGAASSPGIRLKTATTVGLREVPISSLPERKDELLAYAGEHSDWKLELALEKLPPRVVTEVFNLVTIGDGSVGGSATIRYGILNQGAQEFKLRLPSHWKNVEFTGAMIRRKEQASNIWTISLQDKAWGGYTLVVTYDYPFDPKGATLDLAGAHTMGVERETGSLGIMTAASLKVTPAAPVEPLRRIDESELSDSDRSLCTRPLLLAYKYTGTNYSHSVQVTRFEQVPVLDAVADRTEITTVMTEEGQLLTQASFMVKNNEKQFQRFRLPANAELWSSYVNAHPAKPEKDGDWYLVPLPRDADRDQAFAVDIVYAQKLNLKPSIFPRTVDLSAPLTDIPNTYAEWQLFAPPTHRIGGFKGNMTVAAGTTYNLHDAWQQFLGFYGDLFDKHLGAIIALFVCVLVLVLIGVAIRKGFRGAVTVVVLFGILAILSAMLLPALSRAKSRAQRINAVNNLKQIGLAAKVWSSDNGGILPPTMEAMKDELGTEKIMVDPKTGQRFVYVGNGKDESHPEAIIAYSPSDAEGRAVLFADGSVQVLNREKFDEALQRDAGVPRTVVADSLVAAEGLERRNRNMPVATAAPTAAPAAQEPQAAGKPMAGPETALLHGGFGGGAFYQFKGIATNAVATGVRPIRIEIPRAGQAFNFTKVLNTSREPLNIRVSTIKLRTYRTVQMLLQVTAFMVGLVGFSLLWMTRRSALGMAAALALMIWSVASLLIMWRLLHLVLIIAIPSIVFLLVGFAGYKLWKRWKARRVAPTTTPPDLSTEIVASILIPLSLAICFPGEIRAQEMVPEPSPSVSFVSARYTGTAGDKSARFAGDIVVMATDTNKVVPFFGPEVAVENFTIEGDARLVRSDKGLGLLVGSRGALKLQVQFVVPVTGEVAKRRLDFAIPAALASEVSLAIQEPDADVEFPSAVSLDRSATGQGTSVKAIIGVADRFQMNWTPRAKRADEMSATVFAQNTAIIAIGGGVMNTKATLEYQITQGEVKQLQVKVPSEHRLLRVEGEFLGSWDIKDGLLTVELLRGVAPAYKLNLETEKVLERLPVTASLEIPHALGVKRETGMLAFSGSDELTLTATTVTDLQRVDAEEFKRALPGFTNTIVSAYRFLKPDYTLAVRAETMQPQIEGILKQKLRIGPESARLVAQVDYTVKRAGVFDLQLELPPGYRLEKVAGDKIAQWNEKTEGKTRLLDVSLKERTIGAYQLTCILVRSYAQPETTYLVPAVHPSSVEKLVGYITVATEPGLIVRTSEIEGLTEVPFTGALSPEGEGADAQAGTLAYKFTAATTAASAPWTLSVVTESVDAWVRAEVVNSISVAETLVSGRTQVRYEIVNAPAREFRLKVPAAFKNVEITGGQIRRRDQDGETWRVELQGKVLGSYVLTVTWEMPKAAETTAVKLPAVEALGVERETGFISVSARPPLQISERSATELLSRIDVREMPAWAGASDSTTVFAYRYLRPGYSLDLEARRFDEAAVLQALIDSARLTTVVADDGQVMTEMVLSLRNNGRQYLEVELPKGNEAWSAFVSGQPVRPNKREGKLLLPLSRDIASEEPLDIQLTYVGSKPFPRGQGDFALQSPSFDVPVKNARWELYLPPDYEYSGFAGSMNKVSEAGAPSVQVYSLSEYNEQERFQATKQKQELKLNLDNAKGSISGGKLRTAVRELSRARINNLNTGTEVKDLEQVEKEVREAQGSNLISAQNRYYVENAAKFGDQAGEVFGMDSVQQQQQIAQAGNYGAFNDARVAGQQWDKLEKAQQVAAVKVSPLRVNLPTRGVHYSFSQVLQTETGKPLTVSMSAENTKTPGWLSRVVVSVAAFGILWGILAIVNSRRSVQPA